MDFTDYDYLTQDYKHSSSFRLTKLMEGYERQILAFKSGLPTKEAKDAVADLEAKVVEIKLSLLKI